jgi:diguanylate cyclase (GGDEF)-like protein/PAS domain S-box-containing protein
MESYMELRVLIVDSSPDETQLVVRELEKGHCTVEYLRVESEKEMGEALDAQAWDGIICDYALTGFSCLRALEMMHDKGLDLPFIIISGRIGEEAAVGAIRAGASDFLLKDNLSRLVPVLQRELAEAVIRQEQRRAEMELKERLNFIQVLIDTLPTPIFYNDTNGQYLGCNRAFEEQVGLKHGEIASRSIYEILPPDLAALYSRGEEELDITQGPKSFEGTITCASGESRDVIFYSAVFTSPEASVGGMVGALLDISERKASETKLRFLSTHDMLTGIYNRAYFDEELERLKKGRKFPVSIVMADVDRLKETNDLLGHAAGDELLRQTAEVFRGAFRREDVAARIGGDEFAALLPNTDEAALVEAMERLQQHLAINNHQRGDNLLSLSIGAATAHNGEELMAAWQKADQRMYLQKNSRQVSRAPRHHTPPKGKEAPVSLT